MIELGGRRFFSFTFCTRRTASIIRVFSLNFPMDRVDGEFLFISKSV
ncbi:MAG: hypothetical protein IJJ77_00010 [Paludibacteraceae bacterium]|nr:hypothetical protein [Paludibacteraceae bacterium]